ncbi:MAG: heavy metal-binding domain-containing protein, partial [Candidatus Zixiibacteriota bacterium]
MKQITFRLILVIELAVLAIAIGCSTEKKEDAKVQIASENAYLCPMHPEVVSNEPGVCPKCNMFLVHKDSLSNGHMEHMTDTTKQVYICPMHPEVVSDKPGVCPKCDMNLELKETSATDEDSAAGGSAVQLYTCGMHPQIVQSEPGLCPICNMKLVPKSDVMQSGGRITVDAQTQKKIGMAISPAAYRKLARNVRAYGNVTYSEPNQYAVNIKFNGWVEKLYVNETGVSVTKGEPLLEIYSPELVAAQQEYLIAWQTMMTMHMEDSIPSRLVSAAIQKLKNWDITD